MTSLACRLPTARWVRVVLFVAITLTVRGVVGQTASLTLETPSSLTVGALVVLAALRYLPVYLQANLGARETVE